jgi:hypothetical protein
VHDDAGRTGHAENVAIESRGAARSAEIPQQRPQPIP